MEWKPIECAPWNQWVWVKTKTKQFVAVLMPEVALNDKHEWVDQWQACEEGDHPPCWTDGCCWETNHDFVPSEPPLAWADYRADPPT